jgi:hypothetical protein
MPEHLSNREIFERRMLELQGNDPEPKPVHPLLRRPQWLFMAILVVAVVLVGILAAGHAAKNTRVAAEVVLCGGPRHSCRVASYSSCPPCATSSSLTIIGTGDPPPVYRVRLVDGRRATIDLPPRTYVFKVIGTGKHKRNAVLGVETVRVPAHKSATVKLVMPIL